MNKKKYYIYEMNMNVLNVVSILLFIVMVLLTFLLFEKGIIKNINYPIGIIFLLMVPYLCIHELLHSLAYVLHGADFKNITYGANLEKGVLCCLCKQNVTKRNILTSLIYPFIFIGVITYIIGIIIDSPIMIALSVINISGCSGDLIMFFDFLTIKNFEYSEFDNPTAFGLYSEEDFSRKKLFGLDYKETANKLRIKDLKKITISKVSIVYFILIFVVGILWMFVR